MMVYTYMVRDELGLHARPAGALTKLASTFESDIKITKGEKTVTAKRLFGILGLAVKKGESVVFTIEGADEAAAYEAIEAFCINNC